MDEQVLNAPVLVLGNKIDSPTAVSEDEIRSIFKIRSTGKVSTITNFYRIRPGISLIQGSHNIFKILKYVYFPMSVR